MKYRLFSSGNDWYLVPKDKWKDFRDWLLFDKFLIELGILSREEMIKQGVNPDRDYSHLKVDPKDIVFENPQTQILIDKRFSPTKAEEMKHYEQMEQKLRDENKL